MSHKDIFHLICSCSKLPPEGSFTVGQEYKFECAIDTVKVLDNLEQIIVFPDKIFKSCFCDFADPVYPVTSISPVFHDKTIYCIYFVCEQGNYNLGAIKAYSKLMNVNYVQAKRKLNNKRVLVATGNAYYIRDLLNEIAKFQVHYEIIPPYPYQL